MSTRKHSPTPWHTETVTRHEPLDVVAADGRILARMTAHGEPVDADRIVACVNACEPLEHPDRIGIAIVLIREAYSSPDSTFSAAALATNLAITLGIDPDIGAEREGGAQ